MVKINRWSRVCLAWGCGGFNDAKGCQSTNVSVWLGFLLGFGASNTLKSPKKRVFILSLRVKSSDKAVLASEGDLMGDRSIRI